MPLPTLHTVRQRDAFSGMVLLVFSLGRLQTLRCALGALYSSGRTGSNSRSAPHINPHAVGPKADDEGKTHLALSFFLPVSLCVYVCVCVCTCAFLRHPNVHYAQETTAGQTNHRQSTPTLTTHTNGMRMVCVCVCMSPGPGSP